ncbi:putative leucine-rich repeat domain superfamily, F-box-like domain superfamily [Helianthus annuus]|uniref:Leucine-rich repeat domain superfamily, F-box-like domain superfamily n=2 Tax=Helianthus annuus TaxID=4232 RepID=A0A9K3N145_HELAN|nr:transport inhibitor response 1-like protein Os04g0395600 isoform X1 [Helianthus annuus]KAF5782693.1 putative leucine-rich repeat domain superfamily, F-box-like domain superfamily [Helianthus annuus]KAJ0510137.1 putative leucine-rich repeat domain superfamily, F-box-like domain superfamily [Helianthus annuus]KAJ0871379.1 putative leucine-rich repeat domain superfamily, F-box-like domain superfamily [Helianthus annuus]KAJ0875803.1 putative leucine-rich repeat domain superfamily, F-box-like dom
MDLNQKRTRMVDRVDSVDPDLVSPESTPMCPFPDEVLEPVLSLINSHKDRSSVSLVCKDWYNAERWSRRHVFIGNCYSVSPEIVVGRFPKIRSVTLKGKPRFSDFNLVPEDWGADVYPWLSVLAKAYPFLEELRLKRMAVSDESLEFLAMNFPEFKALSLLSCDGFSTDGLKAIATHCRNLAELDIQENGIDDLGGDWLSCFPETLTTLQVLNFASLNSEVNFNDLEKLVTRCKSLRVLKVNRTINLDQLQKLLLRAPQLTELGTGTFTQDLVTRPVADLEATFGSCKNLLTISGLWDTNSLYLPVIYPACASLTFLNLSCAALRSFELAMLLIHCKSLRRLWVLDTVGDMGLEAVGSWCPLLEELRVFPADPFEQENVAGVTESGFVAVSRGCPKLHYVLYFCHQMTNAAVATVVQNCPGFTHFRLCIMNLGQPDYVTNEPMDEAFGAVVRTCPNLQRLAVSGLLTDLTFEYIGKYAKNLEILSVAFAGSSDLGLKYVLGGCPRLRKLEIRDCPFGNAALLSGLTKYESMRSLWMSACNLTMNGCRVLAKEMPRLNVEVMKDEDSEDSQAHKVYIYRTVAGPRRDAPPFVLTL